MYVVIFWLRCLLNSLFVLNILSVVCARASTQLKIVEGKLCNLRKRIMSFTSNLNKPHIVQEASKSFIPINKEIETKFFIL